MLRLLIAATILFIYLKHLIFRSHAAHQFTFDDATPKCFASNFTAAMFARPSIAGALVYTVSEPSSFGTTSSR